MIKDIPIIDYVAATSVGIVDGTALLDLAYEEDSKAEVDMNFVKTGDGRFIELQGTAEGQPVRSPRARRADGARRRRDQGPDRDAAGDRRRFPEEVTGLLIATTNPGKIREIQGILNGIPITLLTLEGFSAGIPEPEETGQTFAENARLKALYYSEQTGSPAVADDSGLEIEALGSAPGIHSARWHGTDYPVKFAEIRRAGGARAHDERRAVRRAPRARARPATPLRSRGDGRGTIAESPAGAEGFGYDPIFFYPPSGVTLAQIPRDEKSRISHRGKAFWALRDFLTWAL